MTRLAWLLLALVTAACDRADEPLPVIRPKNPERQAPRAAEPEPATCPALVIAVKRSGVWIRDPNTQSVVAPCAGEVDAAAVRLRLCSLASSAPAGCNAVEVAAEPGVPYRQLIEVMDAALAAGFPDVGLTDPASLSLPLREPADPGDMTAPRCGKPALACPSRPAATGSRLPTSPVEVPPPALPLPAGSAASLDDAVVIAVPRDGRVLVGGKQVASASEAREGERIVGLYEDLRARPQQPAAPRTAILEVDSGVDSRLVNRVISTARAAGYDSLAFAISR